MSFLKQLQQKLPITLSNEEFKDFQELFDNTESLESLGTKENQGIFKRVENRYGLEDWKTLKYTLNGEEVTMPEGILKFKEWIEDPNNKLVSEWNEEANTLIFNPALNGNELKSVIGDTYKGLDCRYMVPITYHRLTVMETHTIYGPSGGVTGSYNTWHTHYVLGVIYLGTGNKYGKVAFFSHNNNITEDKIWNSLRLKDFWKIFRWLQPSFNTDANDLIKTYTPIIIKIGEFIKKIANKVKGLFKSKTEKVEE